MILTLFRSKMTDMTGMTGMAKMVSLDTLIQKYRNAIEAPVLRLNDEDSLSIESISPDGAHAIATKYAPGDNCQYLLTLTPNVKHAREGMHFYPVDRLKTRLPGGLAVWESNTIFMVFDTNPFEDLYDNDFLPGAVTFYQVECHDGEASEPILLTKRDVSNPIACVSPEAMRRRSIPYGNNVLLFKTGGTSIRLMIHESDDGPYVLNYDIMAIDDLDDCPPFLKQLVHDMTGTSGKTVKHIERRAKGYDVFAVHPSLPLIAHYVTADSESYRAHNPGQEPKDSGRLSIFNLRGDLVYHYDLDDHGSPDVNGYNLLWISPPDSDYDWMFLAFPVEAYGGGVTIGPQFIHYIPKHTLRTA